MKVLIVCSGNKNYIKSFIKDQVESIIKFGIVIDYYLIKGKGVFGYLKNIFPLKRKIKEFNPVIIHAHYGLSGLLANLQRKIPVIITFHGSDINNLIPRFLSRIAIILAAKNIFVSKTLSDKLKIPNPLIIPCGVNLKTFRPIEKIEARLKLNLHPKKKYILFPSSIDNYVKNYPLARQTIDELDDIDIELLELKNLNRHEVAIMLNAVDLVLMTSFSEGSPQFIKESMACNTPIVSVDVGDVKMIVGNAVNCFITNNYNSSELAQYIKRILKSGKRSNGRDFIADYEESLIAHRIFGIYSAFIENTH